MADNSQSKKKSDYPAQKVNKKGFKIPHYTQTCAF